ncbi:restriction endonuclease [Pelagibius marinus]|uniref:restriction endonuclease n=1 Tax=Pelagibius marinus TaxID=2762760 RepID=UPI00187249DD|nr:restriction endonuclease [Pelagibius marinus]
MSNSKRKGDFLEKLVRDLHQIVGDQVEHDVRLPVTDGSGRTRQIDVLLTVAGEEFGDCPVQFPIECKNYGERVGIKDIDSFIGVLHDVGIPVQFGIYVAASGYTADALLRAKTAGIKLLTAEGLSEDRLAVEIQQVLHGVVFWVATWMATSMFSDLPIGSAPDGAICVKAPRGAKDPITATWHVIWCLWLAGKIPCEFGEHTVFVTLESGECAIGDVQVSAYVANLPGQVGTAGLARAETGKKERLHIQAQAEIPSEGIALRQYADREEMDKGLSGIGLRLDIRTPRIVTERMYWPPTHETAKRVRAILQTGGAATFDDIEGRNLLRSWAFSLSGTAET